MNGELLLYRIPSNRYVFASTVRELHYKLGGGAIHRVWADGYHIGYMIGGKLCEAFRITDPAALRNAHRAHAKARRRG